MDNAFWLKLTISPQDLPVFLKNSPFRDSKLSTNDAYQINQFQELFTKPPTRYRAGQQQIEAKQVLNMLIDESDTGIAVVYLMWHQI